MNTRNIRRNTKKKRFLDFMYDLLYKNNFVFYMNDRKKNY